MKKILILFFSVCTSFLVMAQDSIDYADCMPFFPSKEGSILVNKSYDAQNKLLNTMIYRVNQILENSPGKSTEIGFTITDDKDNVIDRGEIDASCGEGSNFYLNMKNRSFSPDVMNILGSNTALVGNFLDYPNIFNDDYLYATTYMPMTNNGFNVRSKETGAYINVRVHERNYEKTEKITTPAETFDAAKISFYFDVSTGKETKTYKGIEWIARNAGIVRSETYDNNGILLNYTVLAELREGE